MGRTGGTHSPSNTPQQWSQLRAYYNRTILINQHRHSMITDIYINLTMVQQREEYELNRTYSISSMHMLYIYKEDKTIKDENQMMFGVLITMCGEPMDIEDSGSIKERW